MNLQKTGRKTTQLKPKPSEANQHNTETLPKTALKRKQRKKENQNQRFKKITLPIKLLAKTQSSCDKMHLRKTITK